MNEYHETCREQSKFATDLWRRLNERTVNGIYKRTDSASFRHYINKGIELRMSRGDVMKLVEDQWATILAIKASGDIPSIDRKDSDGHYEVGNVEFIPLRDNCSRGGESAAQSRADEYSTPIALGVAVSGFSIPGIVDAAIDQALAKCRGNRTQAAAKLGISVRTVQRSLKRRQKS